MGQALHAGRVPKRQLCVLGLWLWPTYPGRAGGGSLCQPAGAGAADFNSALRRGYGGRRDRRPCWNVKKRRPASPHKDFERIVLVLHKKMGMVRSVDVARHMEVSKPSVCHAVATLRGRRLSHDGRRSLSSI